MREKTLDVLLAGIQISENHKFDSGSLALSQDEIIGFAKQFDPLPIHTDPDFASNSNFGNIIASGPHLFLEVYKSEFLPLFGSSVIAGMSISNWNFYLPHFPDQVVHYQLEVLGLKPRIEKGNVIVTWKYTFTNEQGETMQQVEFTILHQLDSTINTQKESDS